MQGISLMNYLFEFGCCFLSFFYVFMRTMMLAHDVEHAQYLFWRKQIFGKKCARKEHRVFTLFWKTDEYYFFLSAVVRTVFYVLTAEQNMIISLFHFLSLCITFLYFTMKTFAKRKVWSAISAKSIPPRVERQLNAEIELNNLLFDAEQFLKEFEGNQKKGG